MISEKPYYETRLVAFIEILGFKTFVKNAAINKDKMQVIYQCLQFLKQSEAPDSWNLTFIETEEDKLKKGVAKFDLHNKISCTCFSGSIVVSMPVDGSNINEATSTLIANIAYIGSRLLTEGILIRGGLTIGELLHEDPGVVMGQALIEANELELNVSKNARIILSGKLLKLLNYPLLRKGNKYPYHQYLKRFEDGCVGFHQMIIFQAIQTMTNLDAKEFKQIMKKGRSAIVDGLNQSVQTPEKFSKYKWLKQQYNDLIIFEEGLQFEFIDEFTDHQIYYE